MLLKEFDMIFSTEIKYNKAKLLASVLSFRRAKDSSSKSSK